MKIKTFIAANISEALELVRQELGSNAVILSNRFVSGKVEVTAAIDEDAELNFTADENLELVDRRTFINEKALRERLGYHTIPDFVQQKIMAACRQSASDGIGGEKEILTEALLQLYQFKPLLELGRVLMFTGTPGSGKSTAIAKAAALARFKGLRAAIVSTDNSKAGANQQLQAFAQILEVDFFFFKDAKALYRFVSSSDTGYALILIDTPGVNPFIKEELDKVSLFADAVKCAKILTFDAGRNVEEAVEVAEIFANMGVRHLLPTRLDLTRRVGSILAVAAACRLSLCGAGVSSSIASGLAGIDAAALAQLILA